MKIGIIGAGAMGGALVRRLRELGPEVCVANSRSPETLTELADQTGATAVWAKDAAADADLIVVSIPQKCATVKSPRSRTARSRAPGPGADRCAGIPSVRRHPVEAPAREGTAQRHSQPHRTPDRR